MLEVRHLARRCVETAGLPNVDEYMYCYHRQALDNRGGNVFINHNPCRENKLLYPHTVAYVP